MKFPLGSVTFNFPLVGRRGEVGKDDEGQRLLELYGLMLRGRRMEGAILELFRRKEMNSTPHLGIGQEAGSVGVVSNLRQSDKVVGT